MQDRSIEYHLRESLFYETSSAVVNTILETILNVFVAQTIRNIEFESIQLSKHNYKILTNLKTLIVLDLGTKSITDKLFGCLPPNLKLLNIAGLKKYEKSEGIKYNLIEVQRIAELSNLKVFIIDADLIFKICALSFIPSSVEVLKIYFEVIPEKLPVLPEPLLHLRELYIECNNPYEDHYNRGMNITHTKPFIDYLQKCIDFESLEQFVFVSPYTLIKIDPLTLEFIETRSGKFYEHFGPIHDEVDRS
ncbi:putative LRR containing protein [Trachipleistophora hominis]|uniref:Putative LRR containing protein n=1 Tax=Trachipleistophora hominis TaxID=72359 RepID=L7JX42_TRAHO|nr:putative LRR containing protein [Trachipleistophora hominis]